MVVFPFATSQNASWITDSDSLSRCEVASSNIIIGAFSKKTRAIPTRCFCPPESLTPLSPTIVSRPFGNSWIKSRRADFLRAACSSSSEAFGRQYIILCLNVSLNKIVSCGTIPILVLREDFVISEISTQSIMILPLSTS